MDEVVIMRITWFESGQRLPHGRLIPADVRHLFRIPNRTYGTFEQFEPAGVSLFLVAKQELHAKTDAQKRRAAIDDLVNDWHEVFLFKPVHGVPGRADARQYHPISGADHIGIGSDDGFFAGGSQCAVDRAEIAGSIINNGNHARTPFVDGTVAGSPVIRVASRSASAPALKI